MARAMLGLWKEAANDLHVASTIDFDEEIAEILKKVISSNFFLCTLLLPDIPLNFKSNKFTGCKYGRLNLMLVKLKSTAENMSVCDKRRNRGKLSVRGSAVKQKQRCLSVLNVLSD